MTLLDAKIGKEYIVRSIDIKDSEFVSFLFSLGCYSGEPITVILNLNSSLIVAIKDARYNIDRKLAGSILI